MPKLNETARTKIFNDPNKKTSTPTREYYFLFFFFTKPLTFLLKQLLSVIKFPTCIERFVKKGINDQNSTKNKGKMT